MSTTTAARGKGYAGGGGRRREGECKANEGKRARVDESTRTSARVN